MVATYCTPQQVVQWLQLMTRDKEGRLVPDEFEFPSKAELTDWIEESESEIEDFTRQSWKVLTLEEPRYYNNNGIIRIPRVGYYGAIRGIYVKLKHNRILTLDNQDPNFDSFECWNGQTWTDMLVDWEKGDAIGHKDWFLQEKSGELWITNNIPLLGRDTIRLKYRHGESDKTKIPKSIRRACILWTASILLESDTYVTKFLNAQNEFSLPEKSKAYQRRAERILKKRRRYNIYNG